MLATGASEARPGVENPKILLRRKNIFVIHSNGEASGLCRVMQSNLSLASAIVDTPQKWFDVASGDFWIFGWGFQCRVAVPSSLVKAACLCSAVNDYMCLLLYTFFVLLETYMKVETLPEENGKKPLLHRM